MDIKNFLFLCTLLLLCLDASNGYFLKTVSYCFYKDQGLEEVEYDIVHHFNQELIMTWNSTQGYWTGYTARGIEVANLWSTYPEQQAKLGEKQILCEGIVLSVIKTLLGVLTAKPNMTVKSVKPSSGRHPSMLVCSAYNFYPKQILVTWLRDGQEITTDISSSQVLSDGDFYYQFHSFLEHTPTSGETITCMVEHPSLTEPMFQHWDSSLPESDRNQIVVGSTGLLLGLVSVFTGLIYYKKKSAAHVTLNQDQVLVPVEELLPPGRVDEAPGPGKELLPPGEMDEASEPEL